MKINAEDRSVKVHAAPENSEGNELPSTTSWYHPFEEIDDSVSSDGARINATCLSDAQIARTIVEVSTLNSNFPLFVQIMQYDPTVFAPLLLTHLLNVIM
jgi:hypothetical protein